MPELPEVETVLRSLERELSGLSIEGVRGHSIRLRRPLDLDQLSSVLPGRRLTGFRRRGKFLLLDVGRAGSLLCHLGMSGRMMIVEANAEELRHTHLVLELSDGRELRYVDPRRFGVIDWLEPGSESHDPSLSILGPEPLEPGIETVLPPLMKERRSPIKSLLLDQRLVAGVGNIYAVEALWRAGIHPRRKGCHISLARLERLSGIVREVLSEAVAEGGTTIKDYATPEGDFGYFAIRLNAYGRQGKPCRRCETTMRAEVIGGRTTAWCPTCQR